MKSSVELIMLAAGPGIDLSGVPLLIRRQPWKQLQAAIDVPPRQLKPQLLVDCNR